MMETTSLESYGNLKSSGLLNKQQHIVFQALKRLGSATASEVTAAIQRDRSSPPDPSWQKRLSELQRKGVVEKLPPRQCRVTKNSAAVWRARLSPDSGAVFDPPLRSGVGLSPTTSQLPIATKSVVAERQPSGITVLTFSICACGTANARTCEECAATYCQAPGHRKHSEICPGVRR